jgi:hypothetical protein
MKYTLSRNINITSSSNCILIILKTFYALYNLLLELEETSVTKQTYFIFTAIKFIVS